jgi:hypothetical protein
MPAGFSDAQIKAVRKTLVDNASRSVELGLWAEALLELDAPQFSVFNNELKLVPDNIDSAPLKQIIGILDNVLKDKNTGPYLSPLPPPEKQPPQPGDRNYRPRGRPIFEGEETVGEPASLGVPLATVAIALRGQKTPYDYKQVADDQFYFLMNGAPRTIHEYSTSHTMNFVHMWPDFVYMGMSLLAYHGAAYGDELAAAEPIKDALKEPEGIVREAYNQVKIYREHLRDEDGLWRYKAADMGFGLQDRRHSAIGNAWAAAGIMRIIATMRRSRYTRGLNREMDELDIWMCEIFEGVYQHFDESTGLFKNVVDGDALEEKPENNFYDAAASCLMAYTAYRRATEMGDERWIPQAEITHKAIASKYLDPEGWLHPVSDPVHNTQEGKHNIVAQSFVLLMHAAWRDWVAESK